MPTFEAVPAVRVPDVRWLPWLALLAAAAVVGVSWGGPWLWLHWLCKPLVTAGLWWLAYRSAHPHSVRYRRWIAAGIGLCLVGDVLLMPPWDLFVPGLLAFLTAHACFIVAFWPEARPLRWTPLLACLAVAAASIALMWPALPAQLHLPVMVYSGILALMAGIALGRARNLASAVTETRKAARYAALGSVLFLASDSVLALDRFLLPVPLAILWVLATYYAAVWCLARSVDARPA